MKKTINNCPKLSLLGMLAIILFPASLLAGPLDSWTSRNSGGTNTLYGATFANGAFVVVGASGTILTSSDGVGWSSQNSGSTNALLGIAFDGNTWVASGGGGAILTSTNLVSWANQTSGTTSNLARCIYADGTFVVMGFQSGVILTSTNATNWISRSSGTTILFQNVAYGNGTFVAVGKSGGIATSPNGVTWTSQNSGTTIDLPGVAFGNGQFVASGNLVLLTSADGVTWASQNSGAASELSGMGYGNGVFVGVGSASGNKTVIDTSPDGTNWTIRVAEAGPGFYGVAYGNGTFVAVGNSGAILQSVNIALAQTVFPIATNPTVIQYGDGIAFDGTNYLVGLVTGTNASALTNVVVQLVSSSGGVIGSQIVAGGGVDLKSPGGLAFGQSNYMVAWSDSTVNVGVDMFGQFISRAAAKVGPAFNLLQSQGAYGFQGVKAVASDGTNFLVVWQDQSTEFFYGQLVTSSGTLSGNAFLISSQSQNASFAPVASGKTNYLVVWQTGVSDGYQTYGAFVSRSGIAGSPFQIGLSVSTDYDPLGVAFDGTNYLVAWSVDDWNNVNGSGNGLIPQLDIYGRLVSQTGAFPGNELELVTDVGDQVFPTIAFDGANYLLAWGYGSFNATNPTIRFQFFNHSASPIGPEFSLFDKQGTNSPLWAINGLLFDGTRFAVAATLGTIVENTNGQIAEFPSAEVYGGFILASTTPPTLAPAGSLVGSQFPLLLAGTPGINYAIQTSTNLTLLNWTALITNSPTNGPFSFTDKIATNASRFYRAVKQ